MSSWRFHCTSFFFSSRRRHTRCSRDWSSDVCSSDLTAAELRRLTRERIGLPEGEGFELELVTGRSEERRVGKSVDLGGRRIIKKKKERCQGDCRGGRCTPVQ